MVHTDPVPRMVICLRLQTQRIPANMQEGPPFPDAAVEMLASRGSHQGPHLSKEQGCHLTSLLARGAARPREEAGDVQTWLHPSGAPHFTALIPTIITKVILNLLNR